MPNLKNWPYLFFKKQDNSLTLSWKVLIKKNV